MYYPVTSFDDDRGDGRLFAIEDIAAGTPHSYTSNDNGVTWTQQTVSDNTVSWQDIAWGGIFAVVGDTDGSMSSGDGVNWTNRTMPTSYSSARYRGVRWLPGLDRFGAVAVATGLNGATLTTSPDGITWTRLTSLASFFSASRCAYGNGTLVVCGTSSPSVQYSTDDGSNWSNATIQIAGYQDVVYVPWLNLFVGGGNTLSGSIWSEDGQTWTFKSTASGGPAILRIAYNDDIIVATPGTGSGVVWTSIDGKNWTSRSVTGAASTTFSYIAWNGSVFCITSYAESGVNATSPDGINWTARSTNGIGFNVHGISARWL